MKASQVIAFLTTIGCIVAEGVTSILTPPYDAPASCVHSVDGKFEILHGIEHGLLAGRDADAYNHGVCSPEGSLLAELKDGILTDAKGRTGYIASNFQFQFDNPPQSGAIFTAGWAHCPNGTLALGPTTLFYKCRSGDFFNIYDRFFAPQCEPLPLALRQCDETGEIGPNVHVVGLTIVTTTLVVPLEHGTPHIITTVVADPVCEIDDGVLKDQTTACAAIAGVPPSDVTMAPLSELPDGQIQITPIGPQPPPHSTEVIMTPPVSSSTAVPPPPTSNPPKKPTMTGNGVRGLPQIAIVVLTFGFVSVFFVI